MANSALAAITCYQCGQSKIDADGVEHPMIHLAFNVLGATADKPVEQASFHLDCLPAHIEDAYRGELGDAIDAAKAGARGDKLRAVIPALGDTAPSAETAGV